jgi:hypothetical protein
LTENHMGNYLEALVLYPKEYKDPANIRRAVTSVGKSAPKHNKPGVHPDLPDRKRDSSAGTITGWHGRHVDLELAGCERKSHLPLRGAIFTGDIPRVLPCMCLFKTSATEYAVLTLSRQELTDMSALGDEVPV